MTGRHDVAAPSRGVLANLRVVWHLVGPDRRGLAVGVVATVLLALLLLVPPLLTKILIDDGITTGDTDVVAGVALASLGLVVVSLGLQVAASYFTYAPSATMVVVLQRQMFRRLVGLPSGYRTTLPVGITLSRLTNDAAESRSLITAGLPVVVTNVVSIVGSVVLMFVIDRRLAMATIAFVLPVLWLITPCIGGSSCPSTTGCATPSARSREAPVSPSPWSRSSSPTTRRNGTGTGSSTPPGAAPTPRCARCG